MASAPLCTQAPARVAVRLIAWGLDSRHVETAVQSAQHGPSRVGWDFTNIERLTTGACPIDVCDPKVIAAGCGSGWAYAVYPVGRADG